MGENGDRGEDDALPPGNGDDHAHRRDAESVSGLFAVLRNRDRRYALYFLLEHGTVSIEELADAVTGWTRATAYGMASRRVRDHTLFDLKHRHVPTLVEAGLARTEDDTVSLEPPSESTLSLIRRACVVETGGDRE